MYERPLARVLAGSIALMFPLIALAEIIILQPDADTTITTLNPDTPQGHSTQLEMAGWVNWGVVRPMLRFDLSSVPKGSTVLSALLTLEQVYHNPNTANTFPAEVWHMPNDNWIEDTATWNSYDQTGGVAVAIDNGPQTNGTRVWSIRTADWNYAADFLDNAVTFEMRWGYETNQWLKHIAYSSREGFAIPTLQLDVVRVTTVSGTIEFLGLNPSAPSPAVCTVDFEDVLGHIAFSRIATLDSAGNYTVMAPTEPGMYFVSVKNSHWLRRTFGPVDTSLTLEDVNFSLTNGDVDEDNEVAIGDYALLSTAYNSVPGDPNWHFNADLNGDEAVDIGDFAILSSSFGTIGDD